MCTLTQKHTRKSTCILLRNGGGTEMLPTQASEINALWGVETYMSEICVCAPVCFPAFLQNKRGCVVSSLVHCGHRWGWRGGRVLRQTTQLWTGETSCLWTEGRRGTGRAHAPHSLETGGRLFIIIPSTCRVVGDECKFLFKNELFPDFSSLFTRSYNVTIQRTGFDSQHTWIQMYFGTSFVYGVVFFRFFRFKSWSRWPLYI